MPLKRYFAVLKNFDFILFGAIFLLICFGLAALYSVAISSEQPNFVNFQKQIIFAVIGLVLLFLISFFDYRIWQDYAPFIYGGTALLLLAVLFFGKTISGTTGWFVIFGFNLQPVELAKLALIIFLAWFFSTRANSVKDLKSFIQSGSAAALFFILVILQPDFGSAMVLFIIWLAIVVFSGVNKKYLLISGLILILVTIFAWFFLFQDYQRGRVLTFVNPQAEPYGRGYHVRQAVTAVGAGGFLGRGLGFGSQSQLKFIPASQTDFIFAVIAEELGFLGVALVLFFWGLVFYRLVMAVRSMRDNFSLIFVLAVAALFFCQVIINIGMNIGIVPVTGISLPFLSYGGSFLITSLVLIGITESMIIRNRSSRA